MKMSNNAEYGAEDRAYVAMLLMRPVSVNVEFRRRVALSPCPSPRYGRGEEEKE